MTCKPNGAESAVYGLGLIGALVYYVQHATSFWNGILGIIYSFFWAGLPGLQTVRIL